MKIAVVGGTGTLGHHVVGALRARGEEVRVLSRKSPDHPIDLMTGEGLADALAGCDVVVDASNIASLQMGKKIVEGTRQLLAAEAEAGVGHHVGISIVGCEHVPVSYYRAKTAQEHAIESGPVPWSLVRATQFHELVAGALRVVARSRVLPIPRAPLQTVAAAEAAQAVADVAVGAPRGDRFEVAGPEVVDARELANIWRSVTGTRALQVPVALPGRIGRALRAGRLTNENPDERGTIGFRDWLLDQR